MSSQITVADLIDAFGGVTRTAERFGVTAPAVSNWKARGLFPDRLYYRISVEAKALGHEVSPSLFKSQAA